MSLSLRELESLPVLQSLGATHTWWLMRTEVTRMFRLEIEAGRSTRHNELTNQNDIWGRSIHPEGRWHDQVTAETKEVL